MGIGSSRVTVVSPDRQVDLCLPDAVPLGDLIGQLLELCTAHHDRHTPLAWTLGPIGGRALSLTSTLESAMVLDGTVLELKPHSLLAQSTTVEDVRDLVEDAVDQNVGRWNHDHRSTLALFFLAVVALLVLARSNMWTSPAYPPPVVGSVAGALMWWSIRVARQGRIPAAHVLAAAGLAWSAALAMGGTTGLQAATSGLTASCRAGLCAVALIAAAGAISWAVPQLCAWLGAASGLGAAALCWIVMELVGAPPDQAIAAGAVAAVMSIGVLPRVSLAAGGLAGLDYRVRWHGSVEPEAVLQTFARSRALLNGALLASASLTAAAAVRLAVAGSVSQLGLSAALTCCLLMRARAFSQFLHVLAVTLAALGAVVAELSLGRFGGGDLPALAVLALVGTGSALIASGGISPVNGVADARHRRALDAAESMAITMLLPLLAANLGGLDWIHEMTS